MKVVLLLTMSVSVVISQLIAGVALAEDAKPVDRRQYEQVVAKATAYLVSKGQAEDGSFSSQTGPAVTAICVAALLRNGRTTDDLAVQKGLKYLEAFIQPDGGIYKIGSAHQNYETCLAILCFSEADKDGKYKAAIANADQFLKGIQWDETENITRDNMSFGGAGYGSSKRPDLSNTSFLIDALRAAGDPEDDPAIQDALMFVSRCQNFESEHNTAPFAVLNPDGGFFYTCAAGGQSQADNPKLDNGGLRSYASMTYAGLKSMIFAGVDRDDPRVKAAYDWVRKNYDLNSNPGLGKSGLYYYYHTFAKALAAMEVDVLIDDKGQEHNWRAELVAELASRQQADGSWVARLRAQGARLRVTRLRAQGARLRVQGSG